MRLGEKNVELLGFFLHSNIVKKNLRWLHFILECKVLCKLRRHLFAKELCFARNTKKFEIMSASSSAALKKMMNLEKYLDCLFYLLTFCLIFTIICYICKQVFHVSDVPFYGFQMKQLSNEELQSPINAEWI